jgi:hypothetical protein
MDAHGIEWKPSGLTTDAWWALIEGRRWHVLPKDPKVQPGLPGNYDVWVDFDLFARVDTQEEGREVVRKWYERHVTFIVSRTLEGWA